MSSLYEDYLLLRLNVPFLLCSVLILNITFIAFASNSLYDEFSNVNLGVNVGDKFTYVLNKFNYSDSNRGLRVSANLWSLPIYLQEDDHFVLEIGHIEIRDSSPSGVSLVLHFLHLKNRVRQLVVFPHDLIAINSLLLVPTDWNNLIPYYQNDNSDNHYYEIEEKDKLIRINYHFWVEEIRFMSDTNAKITSVYSIDISSVFSKNSGILLQRHYSMYKNYTDTIQREYLLRQSDYYDSIDIRVPRSIIVSIMTLMIFIMLIIIRK